MLKLVVCDWNGTLHPDEYEEGFFVGLCRHLFFRCLVRLRLVQAARLVVLALRCFGLLRQGRSDRANLMRYVQQITERMNRVAFAGLDSAVLHAYVRHYGRRNARLLDRRLLTPLSRLHRAGACKVGIISSGCEEGIAQTLAEAGYEVDFIIANHFRVREGRVERFDLPVLDNKVALLDRALQLEQAAAEQTMYVGDSALDEMCFQRVAFPVVSLRAGEEDRRRFVEQYGAFAPRDADAFAARLAELTA